MKEDEKNMENQILDAAEKLFIEQGFAKTTTAQIARVAGCNQALVHYYYRTKNNLFEKIFEEKLRLLQTSLLTPEIAAVSFEAKIVMMVDTYFDFVSKNRYLFPFILTEISSNPERLQTVINNLQNNSRTIVENLDAEIKSEVEKGNIRPISTSNLILTFLSLNITPFILSPIFQGILNISSIENENQLDVRKQEITEILLSRLRK